MKVSGVQSTTKTWGPGKAPKMADMQRSKRTDFTFVPGAKYPVIIVRANDPFEDDRYYWVQGKAYFFTNGWLPMDKFTVTPA